MNIVITGSLGNIGKPLTEDLISRGHAVTVISSSPDKQAAIGALGATAAIGTVEDVQFLTDTFSGADAVFCLVPPDAYFKANIDPVTYYRQVGTAYADAIRQADVRRVVHLSSVGAHLGSGSGLLIGHHVVENILGELPDISLTHLRPGAFYVNLTSFIPGIKKQGGISANYGGSDNVPWSSPVDIAGAVAEALETPSEGRDIRYVASDEATCDTIAGLLGNAIGQPDLTWTVIPDEQMQSRLETVGMPTGAAKGLVEMNASMHNGSYAYDYYQHRPARMGTVKLADFARGFAALYTA
ncbi:NmrA family NAD(P)-binding protein [Spirosoma arcticum]